MFKLFTNRRVQRCIVSIGNGKFVASVLGFPGSMGYQV
jgi:hypothetical protein